jgi:ferredoxin-NADP reductase/DMSO/TMAO reductase YedYZ heme-binding membrane subunit
LSVIPGLRLKGPVSAPADDVLGPAARLAAVAIAGGAFVVVTWWRAAPPSVGPGAALMDAGRLAGLLAGYVALLQVLLRARLPVVERGLGTDAINETHHLLGGYLVALVIGHATLITTGYAAAAGTSVPQELVALVSYPYVLLAMIAACLLAGIVISSLPPARRRLPHQAWHGLHLLVYLALALAFFHQVSVGEHFRPHAILRAAWTTLFAGAAAALIVFRVYRPIYLSVRLRLAVASVVHETANVVSIRIRGRNLDRLHASPGQYFRWRFLAQGAWYLAHPFSLSEEPGGQSLRITVRIGGPHTAMLARLSPGTRVIAEGPCGGLIASSGWRGPVALIAGGVGITPLRALFATASCAGGSISLVYRAHTAADVVFRSELECIAAQREGKAHFLVGGRDDPRNDLSAASLARLCPDLPRSRVFVCGPPGYTKAIRASLDSLGIPGRRIRSESFRL